MKDFLLTVCHVMKYLQNKKACLARFYFLNKVSPKESIPQIKGKLLNSNFFTDSQPSSSKATTSLEVMHEAAKAPAPPIAHRYKHLFLIIEFITLQFRSPLPITHLTPKSNRRGEYRSILEEVVGPQLPIAKLFGVGVGPA